MLTVLGTVLITTAVAASLAGAVATILRPHRWRAARACQVVVAAAALGALVVLALLVAAGDPRVAYAVQHRAPGGSPIGYRYAAVWAGQAGGLLLWVVEAGLLGLFVHPRRQSRAAGILMVVQLCLVGLVALANPFRAAQPGAHGGLNPFLSDPMMLIHPPMLFLGYALLAMPLAITLGALADPVPGEWMDRVRPWLLVTLLALTAGNGFGALWAYKTFGWGGFWNWDPVENTSFVPWVLALAALHAVRVARRDARWLRPAAALSLGGFVAVLYGSFLVRSGLLANASVHAYLAGERLYVIALATLLAGSTILSVVMLLHASQAWRSGADASSPAPATAWGTSLLVVIAGLVLLGMSLPVAGPVPLPPVYNAALLPVVLAVLLMLAWPRSGVGRQAAETITGAVAGVALLLVLVMVGGVVLHPADGVFRAIPLTFSPLVAAVAVWVMVAALRGLVAAGSTNRGAMIAHLGIGALLVGALASGYCSRTEDVFLAPEGSRQVLGRTLSLASVTQVSPDITRAVITVNRAAGVVEVERDKLFNIELRHVWVKPAWWGDLYVTPMALMPPEPGPDHPSGAMLAVSIKPAMWLVWGGMLLIGLGVAVAVLHRPPVSAEGSHLQ